MSYEETYDLYILSCIDHELSCTCEEDIICQQCAEEDIEDFL